MREVTTGAMPPKRSALAETVDEYLAAVPEEARAALVKLRKTIKAAAPKATEVISTTGFSWASRRPRTTAPFTS